MADLPDGVGALRGYFLRDGWDERDQWEFLLFCVLSPRATYQSSMKGAQNLVARFWDDLGMHLVNSEEDIRACLSGTRFPFEFSRRIVRLMRELVSEPRLSAIERPRDWWAGLPGLGLKTASLFLAYTRPEITPMPVALDVHVLRWLQDQGIAVPEEHKRVYDSRRIYLALEEAFRRRAERLQRDPLQLHCEVWEAGYWTARKRGKRGSKVVT